MPAQKIKVFVGYDPRFPDSYAVTVRSIRAYAPDVVIKPLALAHLRGEGVYTRPTERDASGNLRDVISEAPMATEFAISRFLVPLLSGFQGYALFVDGDFLFRDDVRKLTRYIREEHALSVVKHKYRDENPMKMGGQKQTNYPRKNWSSMMLFNNAHPALRYLNAKNINEAKGRDLHGLRWLPDEAIGTLPEKWNWLEGHSDPAINPAAVHFTRGTPEMGMQPTAFADEWQAARGAIV